MDHHAFAFTYLHTPRVLACMHARNDIIDYAGAFPPPRLLQYVRYTHVIPDVPYRIVHTQSFSRT